MSSDMSTDTTTLATDRECVEIEAKARANTVMHWPELVRVINRMRHDEALIRDLVAVLKLAIVLKSDKARADTISDAIAMAEAAGYGP